MDVFLLVAAKSLLIAGGALLLLKLAERRSASDRSWIAHLGLLAIVLLPVATFALPALEVTGPAFLVEPAVEVPAPSLSAAAPEVAASEATFPDAPQAGAPAPIDWQLMAYAVPAVLLLLLTLIALLRLVPLKARANVLVDPHWLSALAHAQRRMGFKNGTALLTSDDLKSPISWGLMRPTILLNSAATDAHDEAEAIIAHELAHVGNFDWAKLLLARVTTALFWFNPLVWLLAREAHQLREEAADDAVLAANIEDTQYASLLVGIARHECRGLLIGAHGVAPGRNSLARRVRRVLDAASQRAPGGWRWSSAAAFFAAGMVVPVAALSLVPSGTPADALPDSAATRSAPAALSASPAPHAIAAAAAAAVAHEVVGQSVNPRYVEDDDDVGGDTDVDDDADDQDSDVDKDLDVDVDVEEDEGPVRVTVRRNPNWDPARGVAAAVARATASIGAINVNPFGVTPEYAAAMRASAPSLRSLSAGELTSFRIHGVTPEYAAAIRAASPALRSLSARQLTAFRIHGVTPALVRDLEAAGVRGINAEQVAAAAIHGINGPYVRGIAAAGYSRLPIQDLVRMRIHGVTPAYAVQMRRAYSGMSSEDLIRARIRGTPTPNGRDDP